jgi:hypothetical protein
VVGEAIGPGELCLGKGGLTITLRGAKSGIPYGSNPDTCSARTAQARMDQAPSVVVSSSACEPEDGCRLGEWLVWMWHQL